MELSAGPDDYIVVESVGGALKAGGIESDGAFAVIRLTKGSLSGAVVIGGKKLAYKGRVLISAEHKGNYSLDYQEDGISGSIQGPASSRVAIVTPDSSTFNMVLIGKTDGKAHSIDTIRENENIIIIIPAG